MSTITFEDILFRLQGKLKKYVCYANQDTNLKLIDGQVTDFFRKLEKNGTIIDYGVRCGRRNNPLGPHNQTVQLIRIGIGIQMPDGSRPQAIINITTKDVDCFVKQNFSVHPDQFFNPQSSKSTNNDAYDYAMGIIK